MSSLEHSSTTSQRNVTGICRPEWCCCHFCPIWFTAKAETHCCWLSSMHERTLYYATRASLMCFCARYKLRMELVIFTSSHQEQQTAGGSHHTAHLPQYVPSCMKLNLRVSRILHGYITLSCWGRMLKFTCSIKCHNSNLEQIIFKN